VKKLLFLLLFLPLTAQAAPINITDAGIAQINVAANIQLKCDCVVSTDANGVQYVSNIGAIYARWTVGPVNFCSKTMASTLFMQIANQNNAEAMLNNASGRLWTWLVGQSPPAKADPWCLQ